MKEILFWLGACLALITVCLIAFESHNNAKEKERENKIYQYKIIRVDGEEYQTDNIYEIHLHEGNYLNSWIEVTFNDGTFITTCDYTLKGKK